MQALLPMSSCAMQRIRRLTHAFDSMVVRFCITVLAVIVATVAGTGSAHSSTGHRFFIEETEARAPLGDILDAAATTGQFTHFLAAVGAAGFEETLRGEGPFTVFAPTDEAFRQLGDREYARLMRPINRDELLTLLAYHVVAEDLTTQNLSGRQLRVETVSGFDLAIDARDGLRINDHLAVIQDIEASNGTIHGVNTVLRPPALVAAAE